MTDNACFAPLPVYNPLRGIRHRKACPRVVRWRLRCAIGLLFSVRERLHIRCHVLWIRRLCRRGSSMRLPLRLFLPSVRTFRCWLQGAVGLSAAHRQRGAKSVSMEYSTALLFLQDFCAQRCRAFLYTCRSILMGDDIGASHRMLPHVVLEPRRGNDVGEC